MNHEENLTGLIEKLRRNREKVPLTVLKTRYAAAYNSLCTQISDELKCIATALPDWIRGRAVREEYAEEIAEVFNRVYAAGGYSRMLGFQAFREMDAGAAIRTAKMINQYFTAALEDYASAKCCLYAPASCWDPERPQAPEIYNDLLGMFWDAPARRWRRPRERELGQAVLIFIDDRGKQNE